MIYANPIRCFCLDACRCGRYTPRCHVSQIEHRYREETHRQKRRAMDPERYNALKEEVGKLLNINFIRKTHYPVWLANSVLVKKSNGKWMTCIDYSDLNKACPKDSFPLSQIDHLVNVTAGHELLSFMDAYLLQFGSNIRP